MIISLAADRKLVAEMNRLKRLQARWKASGIEDFKDEALDNLGVQLKVLAGTQEKDKAYSLAKKYNERLEQLLNEAENGEYKNIKEIK